MGINSIKTYPQEWAMQSQAFWWSINRCVYNKNIGALNTGPSSLNTELFDIKIDGVKQMF